MDIAGEEKGFDKKAAGYVYLGPVIYAPIAQLDRASDYGSEGWGFDSSWAYFFMPAGFTTI